MCLAALTLKYRTARTPGLTYACTRALYARGRLVMWLPPGSNLKVERIQDITAKAFERIAIAKPDVAPYGRAAVESLRRLGIWNEMKEELFTRRTFPRRSSMPPTGNTEVAFHTPGARETRRRKAISKLATNAPADRSGLGDYQRLDETK